MLCDSNATEATHTFMGKVVIDQSCDVEITAINKENRRRSTEKRERKDEYPRTHPICLDEKNSNIRIMKLSLVIHDLFKNSGKMVLPLTFCKSTICRFKESFLHHITFCKSTWPSWCSTPITIRQFSMSGIIGPEVFGISPFQLLAHFKITDFPKTL